MNEQNLIQAAEQGDVSAMKTLANFYAQRSNGDFEDKVGDVISVKSLDEILKVPRNKENPELEAKAYKYYLMAAEAGDAESMTEVARRIYDGIGTERNWQGEEYKMWYRRGAEAGDPAAMRVTAFISEDEKEKFKWFKLSAELDKPGLNKQDSIKQTAINYACGRGTEKDIAKAEEWLAKLDKDDENSARMEIAQITGESSWMEQAAESSPMAMVRMAENFLEKNEFVSALTWYKKAARTKRRSKTNSWAIAAMSIIGDIYYIGEDGIDQDYAEAFKWYSRAAELGYNMAKIKMTLMLYRGLGVEQDLPQAFKNFSEISWTQENFGAFSPFRFNSVARYYAAKMVAAKTLPRLLNVTKLPAGLKGFKIMNLLAEFQRLFTKLRTPILWESECVKILTKL